MQGHLTVQAGIIQVFILVVDWPFSIKNWWDPYSLGVWCVLWANWSRIFYLFWVLIDPAASRNGGILTAWVFGVCCGLIDLESFIFSSISPVLLSLWCNCVSKKTAAFLQFLILEYCCYSSLWIGFFNFVSPKLIYQHLF